MRILIVSQYFYPEHFIINALVERLAVRCDEVVVLTGKPNYPSGKIADGYRVAGIDRETYRGGSHVFRVPMLPRGKSGVVGLCLNYVSFAISGTLISQFLLKNKKFDFILVYGVSPITSAIPALFLKRRLGAHLVIWVQDLWPDSVKISGLVKNPLLLRCLGVMVRWIYASADTLLVQSESFIEQIKNYADPLKIFYYPNFAEEFSGGDEAILPRSLERVLTGRFTIVFGGNLGKAQSLETIIGAAECLSEHAEIKIIVAGSGSEEGYLRDSIMSKGLENVVLVGQLQPSLAFALFRRADALLVTLRCDTALDMTVPSKVQTYLTAKRPIIAAAGGRTAHIVESSDAGIVVPPEDAKALANAILQMCQTDAAEREAMGQRAGAYYERHFEAKDPAERLLEILAERTAGTV